MESRDMMESIKRLASPNYVSFSCSISFKSTLLLIGILVIGICTSALTTEKAEATTIIDVDSFTCEPDFGGTWSESDATCILANGIYVHGTQDVNVAPGVIAVLPSFETIYVEDVRSLSVEGTLVINRGAQLVVASGSTLDVKNGGNINIVDNEAIIISNPEIDVTGVLKITNGTVHVHQNTQILIRAYLNIQPDGVLEIDGGKVVASDPDSNLIVFGDVTISENGELSASNRGVVYMMGDLDINNGGFVSVGSHSLFIVNYQGIIDINHGAVMTVGADSELRMGTPDGLLRINNDGTLTILDGGLVNVNFGAVLGINTGGTLRNSGSISNSGTMYNDCGVFDNQGIYTGLTFVEIDSDGDGIFDRTDLSPCEISVAFSDTQLDGGTDGTINRIGNQALNIVDAPYPDGIQISADPSGGDALAQVGVCGGAVVYSLGPGTKIISTCGSVTTQVIQGPVEAQFVGSDGFSASAKIESNFTLKFEPDFFTFTSPSSNPGSITLTLADGNKATLTAGQTFMKKTVSIIINPGANPISTINTKNDRTITVALLGSSTLNVKQQVILQTLSFWLKPASSTGPITNKASPIKTSYADVNGDGKPDSISQYQLSAFGTLPPGKGQTMCLSGELNSNPVTPFQGCGTVNIMKK